MSHNNLMALYCYIDDRRQAIEEVLTAPETSASQKDYAEGRRQVLMEFENFLHAHLDHKLPRRIYRQLKSQTNSCDIRYAVSR